MYISLSTSLQQLFNNSMDFCFSTKDTFLESSTTTKVTTFAVIAFGIAVAYYCFPKKVVQTGTPPPGPLSPFTRTPPRDTSSGINTPSSLSTVVKTLTYDDGDSEDEAVADRDYV